MPAGREPRIKIPHPSDERARLEAETTRTHPPPESPLRRPLPKRPSSFVLNVRTLPAAWLAAWHPPVAGLAACLRLLKLTFVTGTPLYTSPRPRGFVRVSGPDAASYLQRMVSNDVEALAPGEACEALLLTARARIVAPMTVFRRSADDYLLRTEPDLAERLRSELLRFRFAAKCQIEPEEHESLLVLGAEPPEGAIPNADYGVPAYELLDRVVPEGSEAIGDDELEGLRIRARTPRMGRELDDRVLPAEAGLEERAISFTKGCYPGQEPVARLHYRGHPNRGLRVLSLEGSELPIYDAELTLDGKAVGRVTSAVADGRGGVLALAYVRREVAADALLDLDGRAVRQLADDEAPFDGALHSLLPRP